MGPSEQLPGTQKNCGAPLPVAPSPNETAKLVLFVSAQLRCQKMNEIVGQVTLAIHLHSSGRGALVSYSHAYKLDETPLVQREKVQPALARYGSRLPQHCEIQKW